MKKLYLLICLFVIFFEGFSQIWVNPLTTGRPITSYYLGDRITANWYFQFEIGQSTWNSSEVGIGQTSDGSTGWSWSSATGYLDGAGSNKKVQRDISNFQFTASGAWFVVGRAKANAGDNFTYADAGTWTDDTNLTASTSAENCPYFSVSDLSNPTNQIAVTNSDSQLTLSWALWNNKNVLIVRRLTSLVNNDVPNAGTPYSVGVGAPQLGTGTVVYNGAGTSFTDTSLTPGQSYTYTLYSENNSYYSSGISFTGVTSVTWNGSSWSNSSGPTSSIEAIINGDYSTTTNGVFSAKTLTVNATRSITINSGNTITVAGAITDNGNLVVQNNASLLQTDVSATNSGSIIVNRNSANIQLYDYTLWSSPVAGQKLKAFSPDTLDARFYTYNSDTNQYNMVSDPATTDFAPATGYLIRAPDDWTAGATAAPYSGTFTGVPNNGTINLTGLTSSKFYAVGNPYPSTISASLFLSGNTTDGTLYFWRKTNNSANTSYATYTTLGGVANSGGNSAIVPDGTIQVGQGFIVKTGASSTALNFTNAMRTSSNTSPFLRTTEDRSRFWLNLTNNSGIFSQMLVGYMAEATSGIDNAIDGRYFNDSPIALTSLINGEEYTIQGRALPFNTNDVVPLNFKTDIAGNYTIAIDHVDGFFSTGQPIYLKDNLLNTVTNLSTGSYSFASAIGTFNSRFELVYQSVLEVNTSEFSPNSVIAYSENAEININTGKTLIDQIRVYDLQGRLLVEKKQINATETKITTSASNQVLLLEITATTGTKVIKKIIQ